MSLLPAAVGPTPTTVAAGATGGATDPVDALTKSGQNLVSGFQALAGVWLLLVIMGIGVILLFQRGRKLTAAAGTIFIVFLGSMLIFNPDWVLSIIQGFGLKVRG